MEPSSASPHSPDEKASLAGPQRAGRGHRDTADGNFKPHLVCPFSFIREAALSAWNVEEGSGGGDQVSRKESGVCVYVLSLAHT